MTSIPCQACKDKPKKEGCYICRGYKHLLYKLKTKCCGTPYWARPGSYTSYEGKVWTTFDGLEMVDRESGTRCKKCDGGEK